MNDTDVANMACVHLTEAAIEDLEDGSRVARLLNTVYAVTRQSEISSRWWKFALQREVDVDPDANNTARVLSYHYSDPDFSLRVLFEGMTRDGTLDGQTINTEPTANGFFSDFGGPLTIPYVVDVEDPDDWHPMFVEILAAKLAIKVAQGLANKLSIIPPAQAAYDRALKDAQRTNAIIVAGRRSTAGRTLAEARGDTRMWWRSGA